MFKKLFGKQKEDINAVAKENAVETDKLSVDKTKIYPIIKGATSKDSVNQEDVEDPISEMLVDNLMVSYAVDKGDSFAYLNRTMLANIGLSTEQLPGLAKRNFSKYMESREISLEGDGNLFMVKFDQNMESSLLIVEEFWLDIIMQLNEDLVIAVPSREIVLFTNRSNINAITQLREAAQELYSSGRYKLTNKLILRTIDGRLLNYE